MDSSKIANKTQTVLHCDDTIAEIVSESTLFETPIQALELLYVDGVSKFIIHKANLPPAFFDLSTRLAGEIIQKLANYHIQLAVIGDFSMDSASFQALIRESNRGKQICFVTDLPTAIERLK